MMWPASCTTKHRMGVIYLGYVAESNLDVLYNAARALVFPWPAKEGWACHPSK